MTRALVALCVLWGVTAQATEARYRLSLVQLGGYANNVLATTSVDPASSPVEAGLYSLSPDLSGALRVGPVALTARYRGEVAVFAADSVSVRQWHEGELGIRGRAGAVRLAAILTGAGYDFDAFDEDGFGQLTGALLITGWAASFRFDASVYALGRFFTQQAAALADERRDTDVGATASVTWSASFGLALSAGYGLRYRHSNDALVPSLYNAPLVAAHFRRAGFEVGVTYNPLLRDDAAGDIDAFHWLDARASYRFLPWLFVVMRYRLGADRAAVESLSFTAHEVGLGVGFEMSGAVSPGPGGEAAGVRVSGDTVRFRTIRPAARVVTVVGDFNDWDPVAAPMNGPDDDGGFDLELKLLPGRFDFQYWVDGEFRTPDGDVHRVQTGFGPPNGVVEVRY